MPKSYQPLFADSYLMATWSSDYEDYKKSGVDKILLERINNWSNKDFQKETAAEHNFVQQFFVDTFGYTHSGSHAKKLGYSIDPKYAVKKSGQSGGTGEADLALGNFGCDKISSIAQVVCEFKDIRSNLDSPQKRKGNNRSPVKQCMEYLREARLQVSGSKNVLPTWGIVTDMNEFRLYWWPNMPVIYQRFILKARVNEDVVPLAEETEQACFQRFLFSNIFNRSNLLTYSGKSKLERLLRNQWVQEKEIENTFYKEYRAFRERLFESLVVHNKAFKGTKGKLVRLAQRILDRLIFILYCEDMGQILNGCYQFKTSIHHLN